jgi:hypothetical protein
LLAASSSSGYTYGGILWERLRARLWKTINQPWVQVIRAFVQPVNLAGGEAEVN